MTWYIPAILMILTAHVIFPWVGKHVVMKHSVQKRNLLNFSFCAIAATLWAIWSGQLMFDKTTLLIFAVGIVNGWAAYCQWRAIRISLSRDSLFTFWDDVIAIALSWFILHEGKFVNWLGGIGIVASFLAVVLFAIRDYQKRGGGENRLITKSFYFYVGFYSVVWGVAMFLMRVWGVNQVPIGSFVCFWYIGAWVGALSIFLYTKKSRQQDEPPFTRHDFGYVGLIGGLTLVSLALSYMAFERAPQTIVQPIFLVSEMALPTLIGLWVFGERKGLKLLDWFLIGLAIVGGILVAASYGG